MNPHFKQHLVSELEAIRSAGTYKSERTLVTPQGDRGENQASGAVINMCANNYLGLAQHPAVRQAAHDALDHWGYGLASVRFICGTQGVHKELEASLSGFLGTEDTILYSSCFDANGGLFETLLGPGGRRSSATSSITPRSSTACASARPSGFVTRTATWPISRPGSWKPMRMARASN